MYVGHYAMDCPNKTKHLLSPVQLNEVQLCCCGCGLDASSSNHYCNGKGVLSRVMAFCQPNTEEKFNSISNCVTCIANAHKV